MSLIVSRTDLARRTREIVDEVQRGQVVTVQSYGEDQIVLLDVLDYRILRAVAAYAQGRPAAGAVEEAISRYLAEEISLGKAAELLDITRWELTERLERAGVEVLMGPQTIEEAKRDAEVALKYLKGPND